jgi:hypothetical protein
LGAGRAQQRRAGVGAVLGVGQPLHWRCTHTRACSRPRRSHAPRTRTHAEAAATSPPHLRASSRPAMLASPPTVWLWPWLMVARVGSASPPSTASHTRGRGARSTGSRRVRNSVRGAAWRGAARRGAACAGCCWARPACSAWGTHARQAQPPLGTHTGARGRTVCGGLKLCQVVAEVVQHALKAARLIPHLLAVREGRAGACASAGMTGGGWSGTRGRDTRRGCVHPKLTHTHTHTHTRARSTCHTRRLGCASSCSSVCTSAGSLCPAMSRPPVCARVRFGCGVGARAL